MPLRPHLHLLLPSSTAAISLETRIYLPQAAEGTLGALTPLSTSPQSRPQAFEDLTLPAREALRNLGIRRVVTAAHPWAKLGGNMLFPVISTHLPAAVFEDSSPSIATSSVVATFNVRGVGASGGSGAWLGFGIGHDANDFAAVEAGVLSLVGGRPDVFRLGYSYGTLLALNAPLPGSIDIPSSTSTSTTSLDPPPTPTSTSAPSTTPAIDLRSVLLLSPAPTLFKALTLLSGPTFTQGWASTLGEFERQDATRSGMAKGANVTGAAGTSLPSTSTSASAGANASATQSPQDVPSTSTSRPSPRVSHTGATASTTTISKPRLWLVYGTKDDFTGVDTLRALGAREPEGQIERVEIEDCGHFYVRAKDVWEFREAVVGWLQ